MRIRLQRMSAKAIVITFVRPAINRKYEPITPSDNDNDLDVPDAPEAAA